MWQQISEYFAKNTDVYLLALKEHIIISLFSLVLASGIGFLGGYLCFRYQKLNRGIRGFFQILRIIPSLAVLILLIPVMGTGTAPAVTALVVLAIPPILINTATGLEEVPDFIVETALGLGMPEVLIFWKVKIPLAFPYILTGVKTAFIEIIASATLAAYIGGGGLGTIIFTGLGLNRLDLLLIGGVSVALLSVTSNVLLEISGKILQKYKYQE